MIIYLLDYINLSYLFSYDQRYFIFICFALNAFRTKKCRT